MEKDMKAKQIIGATVELVIKVVVFAAIIMFVLNTSVKAYDYGYRVFAEEPVSVGEGRTISVIVEEFMKGVRKNVAKGEPVYLRGFGSFVTKTRAAKVARNISKNTTVVVPEHKIAYFKAAAEFAAEVR